MLRSPLRPLLRKPMQGLIGPGPYTLVKKAIGILRSYGADAHVYLPGIGTVNGLTAGNYLDSAGTTAASVDNPVGLSLDALQAMTLGSELVTNGDFSSGLSTWTVDGNGAAAVVSGECVTTGNASGSTQVWKIIDGVTAGKTYLVSVGYDTMTGNTARINALGVGLVNATATSASGVYQSVVVAVNNVMRVYAYADNGENEKFDNISVREIPGIHATQATTANKPILRQSGGKYSWQFDGSNDRLTTTFSAGTLGANSDVFMVVRRDTVSSTVLAYSADTNNKYIGSCATSGTSAVSSGAGTPTHYVNGVVLSAQTEVAMSAALPAGSTCIVEVQGANLSTWVNFNVGYYAASAAFAFNGHIYDCIICPAMTANERTTIRKYLAQKNGITLA